MKRKATIISLLACVMLTVSCDLSAPDSTMLPACDVFCDSFLDAVDDSHEAEECDDKSATSHISLEPAHALPARVTPDDLARLPRPSSVPGQQPIATGNGTFGPLNMGGAASEFASITGNDKKPPYASPGVPGSNPLKAVPILCQTDSDCTQHNDSDLCNGQFVCLDGRCTFDLESVVTCDPALDSFCEEGLCNPATGLCQMMPINQGEECDDGNACTEAGACQQGKCAAIPVSCSDNNKCTLDGCDPDTGCYHNEKKCSDGNACTQDSCSPPTGKCGHQAVECDDGDACTVDGCEPDTGCVHTQLSCDDGDPCTVDGCSADSGCTHTAVVCEPMNPCLSASCVDGECKEEPIPCPYKPCKTGKCDPGTGKCIYLLLTVDDGDWCTIDSCEPATGEVSHVLKDAAYCDDLDACTKDYCNPSTGLCVHDEKQCDDGDLCTVDSCHPVTGECVSAPMPCPSGPCHHGACDKLTGKCVKSPTDCDDGDVCTEDSCQSENGECVHEQLSIASCGGCVDDDSLLAVDALCEDGNLCTAGSCLCLLYEADGVQCSNAECIQDEITCDDSDDCTEDSCDPDTGCINTYICGCCPQGIDKLDDTLCEDKSPGTGEPILCTADSCYLDPNDGGCKCKNEPVDCNDDNLCTYDSCDPTTGKCNYVKKNCDDGNSYTYDYCSKWTGKCIHEWWYYWDWDEC